MQDKIFFDTNIIVYLYSEDEIEKREKIINIASKNDVFISTQVINEFSNVLYKKFNLKTNEILPVIEELQENFEIVNINMDTIKLAHRIKDKYKYSYFDSLIISSALENDCNILFTEDLHNSQKIEEKLKIINPFK